MKLSIVATLYQSSPYIDDFCLRAGGVARQLVLDDYEIILVNDGSPDDSMDRAVLLANADPHIVLIDLSRNFGHHKAMMTGLAHARGDHIFLIDSDLEEEPEWLLAFSAQLGREKCDVVYGVQEQRKGNIFERLSGFWFYRLFQLLTGLKIPANIVTARLMSRRYVDALLLHEEREICIFGLWYITGFSQSPHTVKKHASSESTYTFRRKMSTLVNSVTSFSNLPLIFIFYVGVSIFLFAGAYTTYLVGRWLFYSRSVSGWTSVMASIWLLGGLVISFIGIVGIYLSKIFVETKRRPYTIIRSIYSKRSQ